MGRAFKLLFPILTVAGALLVWSDTMELGNAILVVVGLEVLLTLAGIGGIFVVIRRYRQETEEGLDAWAALERSLMLALPRKIARLIVHEPKIIISLFRWIFGRVKPSKNEFGYHKRSILRMFVPLVILTAPIELLVVHLLLDILVPWGWVKWVVLIVSVYAIFWLLGFYASVATLPHRLEKNGIRMRYGAFTEGFIPYEEIADIQYSNQRPPKYHDGLQVSKEDDIAYLVVGGNTNITLSLRTPHSLRGFLEESKPFSAFHLVADEPERFLQELRQFIEASASREAHPSSSGDL